MTEDEDDIYSDPELVEDFLQKVLWPILEFGPNSEAFHSLGVMSSAPLKTMPFCVTRSKLKTCSLGLS